MKVEIKIPEMGESVVEATIGHILKPSGSQVSPEDEIVEIETDKVNQVLFAPASGQIQFSVSSGDVVKVGDTIGFIETEAIEKAPSSPSPPQEALPSPSSPTEKKGEVSSVRKKIDQ